MEEAQENQEKKPVKIALSDRKLQNLLPVIEKVNEAFGSGKEIKFFLPSSTPKGLYKDLWVIRTALNWSGRVRFTKRDDGIEILVRAATIVITDFVPASLSSHSVEAPCTTIADILTLTELATRLTEYANENVSPIKVSLSHLTIPERVKLDRVFAHLKYLPSEIKNWTLLTRIKEE